MDFKFKKQQFCGLLILIFTVFLMESCETNYDKYSRIAAGGLAGNYSLAISANGILKEWGFSASDWLFISPPRDIGTDTNWKQIAAGGNHRLAIRNDGTLWAWGGNKYGTLGDGTTIDRSSPVQIGTATDWSQIAAGSDHSLGIHADGTLWAWGYNYGTLGATSSDKCPLGGGEEAECSKSPIQVGTDTNWSQVATSGVHNLAIRTDGTLWAWGGNINGTLGDGTTGETSIQTTTPIQIGTDTNWGQIAASQFHSLGIRTDGTLWAWGENMYGQLGTTSSDTCSMGYGFDILCSLTPIQVGSDSNWSQIAAGDHHSLAIRTDGTLWAWGYNDDGELGMASPDTCSNVDYGDVSCSLSPIQVGSDANWSQIAAGSSFSLGIRADGTLWSWGSNSAGEGGPVSSDTCRSLFANCNKTPIQVP